MSRVKSLTQPLAPAPEKPLVVKASTVVTDASGRQLNPPLAPEGEYKGSGEGEIDIDSYFNLKKIPADHRAGMRHFANRKVATVPEWDALFATY